VAQRCLNAVQTEKVLFPVSFSSVTEVIEQPTATKRAHVATLMDDLSKGLCFRSSKELHEMEANLALPIILGASEIAIERQEILTWIVEFAARITVQFPPSWKQADADKFTRLLAERPELRSVKWLVDHSPPNQMRLEYAESMGRYVEQMTTAIARSKSHYQHLAKDIRREQLLLEERLHVVKQLISPKMSKNLLRITGPEKLLDTIAAVLKQVGEGSKKRLEEIMKAMPSLDLQCHIMAERACNHSRKAREQDFFDVEHAIAGGAYADFFITSDGDLFDLLTNRCSVSADQNCRVVRGVKGLEDVLDTIHS
jgi:succinate dehydrogenase flavin-adding protein (antitoxin of CptAB toxin-antitoxin module)